MRCSKCSQYEEDEGNDNRGWCWREHCWVDWNETSDEMECGYDN